LLIEGLEDSANSELVGGLVKLDDVVVLYQIGGVLAQEAHFGEVILMLEVLLEAVLEPIGDVLAVE